MAAYIIRRIFSLIPVLFGITLLAFLLAYLAPGDPAGNIWFSRHPNIPAKPADLEDIREEFGLDDPLLVRYVRWMGSALQGDLGNSYRTGRPVLGEFLLNFPNTLRLALIGLVLGLLIAFPLGILAAVYPNTLPDLGTRMFSMLGAAMPSYWLAYIFILFFSVRLKLFPVAGTGSWLHFVLPAIVLGIGIAASISRLLRSSMLDVFRSDYIRAARARGIKEKSVIVGHSLRNALIPVVTHIGSLFGFLIAGAVIIETVFAIPGIGSLVINAIGFRDYPVIQAFVVYTGIIFVLVNLFVDLSYTIIDPRVRLTGGERNRG
ncbi:MAG: ABC transporter permease [Anaerolineales bacterium]|nr:ABC transporter permease [Anaerolineales bacterium]